MKKGDLAIFRTLWDDSNSYSLGVLTEDATSKKHVHIFILADGLCPRYSVVSVDCLTSIECKWLKIKYKKEIDALC